MLYRHCENCGKDFICQVPGEYLYVLRIGGRKVFYCCYHCWLEDKKKLQQKKSPRRIDK